MSIVSESKSTQPSIGGSTGSGSTGSGSTGSGSTIVYSHYASSSANVDEASSLHYYTSRSFPSQLITSASYLLCAASLHSQILSSSFNSLEINVRHSSLSASFLISLHFASPMLELSIASYSQVGSGSSDSHSLSAIYRISI